MWGDDTGGAREEKHIWEVEFNVQWWWEGKKKQGNTREELTVAGVQYFYSFCSLPLLLTRLWVEGWKRFMFMTADIVGEQLADCLSTVLSGHFQYQEEFKKNRAQFFCEQSDLITQVS